MHEWQIRIDDLGGPEIQALLQAHLQNMRSVSPPQSSHALDLDALRAPDIRFWSLWQGDELCGCGALKTRDSQHGEIKSMRTDENWQGRGVATKLLEHIIDEARALGMSRLSLETGSMAEFKAARNLYEGFGFVYCEPFGGYRLDPNSLFMTLALD